MCKLFFCGKKVTPIIIEETGFCSFEDVCEDGIIFWRRIYDYEIPDNILYDDYNLNLKNVWTLYKWRHSSVVKEGNAVLQRYS